MPAYSSVGCPGIQSNFADLSSFPKEITHQSLSIVVFCRDNTTVVELRRLSHGAMSLQNETTGVKRTRVEPRCYMMTLIIGGH